MGILKHDTGDVIDGEGRIIQSECWSLITSTLKSQDTDRNSQSPLSPELYKLHKPTKPESAFTEIINAVVTNCIDQVALQCTLIRF